MTTDGVSPVDALREQARTELKLTALTNRDCFILPNQGPSVLPLAGKAGSPFILAQQARPKSKRHSVKDVPATFERFRPTQFKETLPVSPNLSPREEAVGFKPGSKDYAEPFVVRRTFETINNPAPKTFRPTHATSNVSHWRTI